MMEEYVRKCLHLLELERAAEEAENRAYISEQLVNPKQLESRGICIQKLQVGTYSYGKGSAAPDCIHPAWAARETNDY